ncbi:MAG: leucine-rich repeat domain-containing protein [Deltaproteobacteria bacterium]|nr:leucine-rich repeat domain-containing protein [Deltaproteobacteria bacterium]
MAGEELARCLIEREREEQTGFLDLGNLGLTRLPDELLSPLAGLVALQLLDFGYTPVADLRPLAGLHALERFSCQSTQVADLSPLAGLVSLYELAFGPAAVTDLELLGSLKSLGIYSGVIWWFFPED